MFYQFTIIENEPFFVFRTTPNGEWQPASKQQILDAYLQQYDRITNLINENTDLLEKIHELETYHGPNCPKCGSGNPIPLFTRVQCPQCNKVYTV